MAVVPSRYGILTCKLEATPGTDPVPAAADALDVINVQYGQEIEQIERNIICGNYAPGAPIPGAAKATISFDVQLHGSGTAGTAPKHGPAMQACGYKETVTGGTSVGYTPDPSGQKTCTIYFYRGGHIYKLVGCAGVSSYKATPVPTRSFKMTGKLVAVVAGAAVSSPTYSTTLPIAAKSCSFTFGGQACVLRDFSIDDGAQLVERKNINDATGYDYFLTLSFKPTAALKVEDMPIGTYDWRAQCLASAAPAAWTITHGTVAGNICVIHGHAMRLSGPSESDNNGVLVLDFKAALADSAVATPDFLTELWT